MRVNPIGWVLAGFFLLAGAAFALFPATRLLGIIWVVVAVMLIAFYALLGGRARRREQLMATGVRGTAVIRDISETGTRINDQPLLVLDLEVSAPGIAPYELEKREVVPWVGLNKLGAGARLAVAIDPDDHSKVVIDWRGFDATPAAVVTPPPAAASLGGGGSGRESDSATEVAARLRRIDELRDSGAITDSERERLRAEALAKL